MKFNSVQYDIIKNLVYREDMELAEKIERVSMASSGDEVLKEIQSSYLEFLRCRKKVVEGIIKKFEEE